MIKLLQLEIRNFLSYGDNITTVPLNVKEPTLIIGENLDVVIDGEHDNNGAGKTSILNALAYALYGKTVSDFKKLDDIINNINKKNLYVSVIFEINKRFYKVERWRKNKQLGGSAGNGVRIIEADKLKDLIPDNEKTPAGRTVDEYISDEILRMPFDIFVRIVVYSARFEPFLNLPVTSTNKTSQTSILEELFGHKELTEKANKLKSRIKNTKTDLAHLVELNDRIEREAERYNTQLEQAEASIKAWDDSQEERISNIKSSIEELEKINFEEEIENQQKIKAVEAAIFEREMSLKNLAFKHEEGQRHNKNAVLWEDRHRDEISNFDTLLKPYRDIDFDYQYANLTKILKLKADRESEIQKISSTEAELKNLLSTIEKLDSEVKTLKSEECPYCHQHYAESASKIDEKEKELLGYAEDYTSKETNIEESRNLCEQIVAEIDSIDCMFDSEYDYTESKRSYETLKDELEKLKSASNPYSDLVDIKPIEDDISVQELEKTKLKEAVVEMKKDGLTLESLYEDQTRLKELRKTLVEKINEENPHKETLNNLQKVFESIDTSRNEEIDQLKDDLVHQEFLLKLLTKKDSFVRQALLDVNLPFLNTRLRHYLDAIGLPHKVEFTKGMTIEISQFNNSISYSNLSGGQQARINIAISFAFRDVVQARHQKVNFCILDECLDTGLSNLGVKMASKMIKQIAEENDLSMYVITHRDEIKSSFDKSLKTTLRGGLTTITYS